MPLRPGTSFGADGEMRRQTIHMASAARNVVPVLSISTDHASPFASLSSGMSTVSARPPMPVMISPLAWSV